MPDAIIEKIDAEIASIEAEVRRLSLRLEGLLKARELLGGLTQNGQPITIKTGHPIDVPVIPKTFFLNETHDLSRASKVDRRVKDGPTVKGRPRRNADGSVPTCPMCKSKPCKRLMNGQLGKTCGEAPCPVQMRVQGFKSGRAEGH